VNAPDPREPFAEAETQPAVPSLAEALTPRGQESPRPRRAGGEEDEYSPRYVAVPRRHDASRSRNLAFGGGALFLALLIGGAALFIVGPRAIVPLAACLITFLTLYVLARLEIFREAHGAFLALGIVCLVGSVFALAERAFHGLDGNYWMQLAAPPPPVRAPAATPPPDRGPALLTEAFALVPPDPTSGPRVRALKDSRVLIEGRPFLIKAGDLFALVGVQGEKATLRARDLHIDLPVTAVEILEEMQAGRVAAAPVPEQKAPLPVEQEPAPAKETIDPAVVQVTKSAQNEAVRRYPALGIEGSRENTIFVTTFRSIKDSGDAEFFKNPEWPLELAELLAKRQGWQRDDIAANRPPPLPPPSSDREPQLPLLEE
jgi:hypothetical protein